MSGYATALIVQHSSESAEHASPPEVVGHALRTLGGIDLDPASCELANTVVEADVYFDLADDGFNRDWFGRVFVNPPGGLCDATGRPVYPKTKKRLGCSETGACGLPPGHAHRGVTSSAKAWWFKLLREVYAGRVSAAYFVGFSLELEQAAQLEAPEVDYLSGDALPPPQDFAHLVPRQRLRFLAMRDGRLVRGDQPTHANVLVYVGPSSGLAAFQEGEAQLGRVVVPRVVCPRKLRPALCVETRGWCRREHAL